MQVDGTPAKANDSGTWNTYEACTKAKGFSGVGNYITDPWVGCDLDWKKDPNARPFDASTIPEYAKKLIREAGTYTEWSPSGMGVHQWARRPANSPSLTIKNHEAGVEVYTGGRYFTYTGRQVPGTGEEITYYNAAIYSPYGRSTPAPVAKETSGGLHIGTGASMPILKGSRNDTLFRRASALRGMGLDEPAILAALEALNREHCDPPMQDMELQRLAHSVMRYEAGSPEGGGTAEPKPAPKNKRLVYRWGDTIKPEPLEFFWDPVLPMASLTHFGGASSNGKSPVTVDLAARISTGADWPDGSRNIYGPRSVIMLNVEDRAEDTIVPRFLLAGGDPKKLCVVEGTQFDTETAEDLERMVAFDEDMELLQTFAEGIPDLGLLSVDPITNYLGKQRMNNEAEVRSVLTPIAKLCQRLKICGITVGHHNKSDSKSPLEKMMGAAAFVGVARAVWSFGPNPEGESQYCRMMAPARGNIGDKALHYRTTVNAEKTVSIIWEGWGEGSAEDTVTHVTREDRSKEVDAGDRLRDFLEESGPQPARVCKDKLREWGVTNESRARRRAGVFCVDLGKKKFVWKLEWQTIQESLPSSIGDKVTEEKAQF